MWLSLRTPDEPEKIDGLIGSALDSNVPIDISRQPGLWGGRVRGKEVFLTCSGNLNYENAVDEQHAHDLTSADLIQTLSSIGREYIDIYFLRLQRAVEEFQISGVLEALELARQEGHIRYIGLHCDGSPFAALATWQFHDAFDLIQVNRNPIDHSAYDTLRPLAKERRVGIVTSNPIEWRDGVPFTSFPGPWRLRNLCKSFYGQTIGQAVIASLSEDHPVLVGVSNQQEVEEALEAPGKPKPEGLDSYLEPFVLAYEDEDQWRELASGQNAGLRIAAARRSR